MPVFDEAEVIPLLHERLHRLSTRLGDAVEMVFVNDGSTDDTYEILRRLAADDPRLKIVNLSRNFGHQVAITAGVDAARGDAVVVMDADLQDPPEVVEEMVARYREGYDVVYAVRRDRSQDRLLKRWTAAAFYRLMRWSVHRTLPENAGDFRLMSRAVVEALRHFPERHRFVRGMVAWLGFRQTEVSFVRPERAAGESKYPLWKMVRFAADAITSFSYAPLRLAFWIGLVVTSLVFAFLGVNLILWMSTDLVVPGWLSIAALGGLLGGLNLVFLGIVGEYVGRIYEESKRRPLYVVRDLTNCDPPSPHSPSGGFWAGETLPWGESRSRPRQEPPDG